MNQACIGIGSNDDAEARIRCGLTVLGARYPDLRISRAYWCDDTTNPAGAPYLNLAAMFSTTLGASALRAELRLIEAQCGRRRDDIRKRVALDLDLLILITPQGATDVPEWPQLADSPHELAPLAELLPHWCHPQAGCTLAALWQERAPQSSALRDCDTVLRDVSPSTLESIV